MGEVVQGNFPQAKAEPADYVTVPEFARITGLSRDTVYRAVRDGSLPHIRVRRSIRIPRIAARIDSKPSWYQSTPGFGHTITGA